MPRPRRVSNAWALYLDPAKKPRAKPRRLEDLIQIDIVRWLRGALPHGWIVHHCANKPRSRRQGGREKGLGAVSGWPDIEVWGPADHSPPVCFFEVKFGRNKVEPGGDQEHVHDLLNDLGYPVAVVRSLDEAKAAALRITLPILEDS